VPPGGVGRLAGNGAAVLALALVGFTPVGIPIAGAFAEGSACVIDARFPAMAAALVALRARQHQAVVLLVAAGIAASVRAVADAGCDVWSVGG
jgi:hypothetical protein